MLMVRSAFTLVELLVVIAIVAILVGISVPTVQSVRESARQTDCRNNLRNLAITLHQYQESHRSFPPGQDAPLNPAPFVQIDWTGHSGLGHLWHALPYFEQNAIRGEFESSARNLVFWGTLPGLPELSEKIIAMLRCKSDPQTTIKQVIYTNLIQDNPGATLGNKSTPVVRDYEGWTNYLGSRGTNRFDLSIRHVSTGIFFEQSSIRPADITDGLSNTILVGEVLGGTTGHPFDRVIDKRHSIFQNGVGGSLQFFFDITDDATDNLAFTFSSSHLGGHLVNFSFADGSVRPITNDIDPPLFWAATTRSGVW